jgi:hypothetical protein
MRIFETRTQNQLHRVNAQHASKQNKLNGEHQRRLQELKLSFQNNRERVIRAHRQKERSNKLGKIQQHTRSLQTKNRIMSDKNLLVQYRGVIAQYKEKMALDAKREKAALEAKAKPGATRAWE